MQILDEALGNLLDALSHWQAEHRRFTTPTLFQNTVLIGTLTGIIAVNVNYRWLRSACHHTNRL